MSIRNYAVLIKDGVVKTGIIGWDDSISHEIIFWGPEVTEQRFNSVCIRPELDISIISYCDWGGAVFDYDKHHCLFYGGGWLRDELLICRQYMRLCRKNWPGWTVSYAYGGTTELCDYLGLDYSSEFVEKPESKQDILYDDLLDDERLRGYFTGAFDGSDTVSGLLSISNEGRLNIYPLYDNFLWSRFLLTGEKILALAADMPSYTEYLVDANQILKMNEPTRYEDYVSLPDYGVHILTNYKEIYYWLTDPHSNRFHVIKKFWPGWTVHCWGGAFEKHIEATEEKIRLIPLPDKYYIDIVRKRVTSEWAQQQLGLWIVEKYEALLG